LAASDQPVSDTSAPAPAGPARLPLWQRLNRSAGLVGHYVLKAIAQVKRGLEVTVFSSLARRIIVLNFFGLAILVVGILFLNQWRTGLIEARVQSLRVQGEIIAAAIAASATVDSDVITVNPDRLLETQGGDAVSPLSFFDPQLEFPINPEQVAPLLRNLVTPTKTRARIYDQQGLLILDSANLYARGEVLRQVPKPADAQGFFLFDWWNALMRLLPGDDYPQYVELGPDEGKKYPEVAAALSGAATAIVRVDSKHQLVVSVAVPVQRVRANVGVLLLSTQPGDIDAIATAERWSVLRLALVAAAVQIILSLLMAGTIAGPLRRLAGAAERVQASISTRAEIPDYSSRTDEVGHLARALRAMTSALYARLEAIERFAADVAHELKNPLTSLRSAVETLPLAKRAEDRARLNAIIQHDVRRLDRLISDISNASRLDAELARQSAEVVDIGMLADAMVSIQKDVAQKRNVNVVLETVGLRQPPIVLGHDSRLAQVINNLVDNAVSFSPEQGTVRVALASADDSVTIVVTDEGPGIRGDISRIFQRFYTDRPDGEHFGDHSGLGLAICKQIVEAHGGTIEARNRTDRSGAEFTVRLRRAPGEKRR
jgi:two-component system sensor histidine kinase ChvG